MFMAILLMVMIRFMFWAVVVAAAIVLATAACLGVIAGGIIGRFNEERGHVWHEASVGLINGAIRSAMFADNHRRWLLPNTERSKRYAPGSSAYEAERQHARALKLDAQERGRRSNTTMQFTSRT